MPLLRKEIDLHPPDLFELSSEARPWLVLHVRSRQEKVLARHLLQSEIPFYLPLIERRWLSSGRRRVAFVPLFPGYVFARPLSSELADVLRSNVIANVIDARNQQAELQAELAQIRRLQLAGASFEPKDTFVPGDAVRITNGAFEGYTGIIMRESGRDRLIVQLTLLRHSVVVEFESQRLRRR